MDVVSLIGHSAPYGILCTNTGLIPTFKGHIPESKAKLDQNEPGGVKR